MWKNKLRFFIFHTRMFLSYVSRIWTICLWLRWFGFRRLETIFDTAPATSKMTLPWQVIINDSKKIIFLCVSKSVTPSVEIGFGDKYIAFLGFEHAKFPDYGLVLSRSQFTLLPQLPLKTMLDLNMVKIHSKIIISSFLPKFVTP